MQRLILLQIQQKSVRMEPSGFGNNEKQQRPIWGSASGTDSCNARSVVHVLRGEECFLQDSAWRCVSICQADKMAHT